MSSSQARLASKERAAAAYAANRAIAQQHRRQARLNAEAKALDAAATAAKAKAHVDRPLLAMMSSMSLELSKSVRAPNVSWMLNRVLPPC